MKHNLLFLFITIALASCSTYNYQSYTQDLAIYELKTEPKESLFTESDLAYDYVDMSDGLGNLSENTLKFYIHDLDESLFHYNNIQIYDSTFAGELEVTQSDIARDSLTRKNIHLKNEVHINIDKGCTNKNSKIYLETNDVLKPKSHNLIRQKKVLTKKVKIVLIVCMCINVLLTIGFFVWKNNNNINWL